MNSKHITSLNHHIPFGYMTILSYTKYIFFNPLPIAHIPAWYMIKLNNNH